MSAFNGSGKFAVVTGGGSGITLDFVKLLLAKGTSVIVGDLSLRPEAEEVAKSYPATGETKFIFQKTDVSSWRDLSGLWKAALEAFPQIDLVVPGAGVYEPPFSSFWLPPGVDGSPSVDDADSEAGTYKTFGINLIHPIRLSQLALSYWTQNKIKGHLLFLGSIAGYTATVGTPFYYSSKHGLHGFVKSLAPLRGRLGIRVSCVAPGATRTPLWDADHCKAKLTDADPQLKSEFVAQVMLNVLENEKYGDGNIVEVMDIGTPKEPNPSVREVPVHLVYPAASGVGVPTLILEEEKLWSQLETNGFNAF
ncbi:Short-chain dehydrogenase reductase 3b [Paramyrothecium foliicola]|nr:Short-chain dehydrogenase reductase 3b [Paramyrothecium foliicola]